MFIYHCCAVYKHYYSYEIIHFKRGLKFPGEQEEVEEEEDHRVERKRGCKTFFFIVFRAFSPAFKWILRDLIRVIYRQVVQHHTRVQCREDLFASQRTSEEEDTLEDGN